MDVFSRTFLPATSEAGIPMTVVSRHMPVLRRCIAPEDTTLLVARCARVGQPMIASVLLLLTNRQLVVSRERRVLHRVQLQVAAPLRDVSDVDWTPDPRARAIELAATLPGGVRERFRIQVRDPRRVAHVDAVFSHAFRSRTGPASPATPRGAPPRLRPAPAF
jgi:hypothetical protein